MRIVPAGPCLPAGRVAGNTKSPLILSPLGSGRGRDNEVRFTDEESTLKKKKVAVMMGGLSREREISLKTGRLS